MEHIIGSPVFGSGLGSVIGSLQTLSWSAYSVGLHTARILLIPDIARYKQSTTVLCLIMFVIILPIQKPFWHLWFCKHVLDPHKHCSVAIPDLQAPVKVSMLILLYLIIIVNSLPIQKPF